MGNTLERDGMKSAYAGPVFPATVPIVFERPLPSGKTP